MSNNGKPFPIISSFLQAFNLCDLETKVSLQLVRWQVITAFNIISEATIFGMSIYLVFGLRMALSQKSVVVSAFGMRLP